MSTSTPYTFPSDSFKQVDSSSSPGPNAGGGAELGPDGVWKKALSSAATSSPLNTSSELVPFLRFVAGLVVAAAGRLAV